MSAARENLPLRMARRRANEVDSAAAARSASERLRASAAADVACASVNDAREASSSAPDGEARRSYGLTSASSARASLARNGHHVQAAAAFQQLRGCRPAARIEPPTDREPV